jgi:cell division protein FtsB
MAVQAQDINTMNSLSTSDKIQMLRVVQDLQAQIAALEARVAALEAAAAE